MVNVGSKARPVYLPPEVCVVMPGEKAGVKLNADQTSKMISYAIRRPPPAQNALSIAQEGLPMVGMSRQTNPLLVSLRQLLTDTLLLCLRKSPNTEPFPRQIQRKFYKYPSPYPRKAPSRIWKQKIRYSELIRCLESSRLSNESSRDDTRGEMGLVVH